MNTEQRTPWKTTLLLTASQRERLDELATRIRKRAEYRPGASELIRALVDSGLERIERESLDDLQTVVGMRGPRQASPLVEEWLRQRLAACTGCVTGERDGRDAD